MSIILAFQELENAGRRGRASVPVIRSNGAVASAGADVDRAALLPHHAGCALALVHGGSSSPERRDARLCARRERSRAARQRRRDRRCLQALHQVRRSLALPRLATTPPPPRARARASMPCRGTPRNAKFGWVGARTGALRGGSRRAFEERRRPTPHRADHGVPGHAQQSNARQ